MARRKSSVRQSVQRNASPIATRPRVWTGLSQGRGSVTRPRSIPRRESIGYLIRHDARRYDPTSRLKTTWAGRVRVRPVQNPLVRSRPTLSARLSFVAPSSVFVCARRSVRRQVLFALDRRVRRGSSGGSRRRTVNSSISC